MSYRQEWYIPKRVIYSEVWGNQTLEEIAESNKNAIAMLEAGQPLVHALINDQKLGKVPISISQLQNTVSFARHPSLGWVILIGGDANSISAFVGGLLGKIFRVRYVRVATFDDAIAFLKERDTTIPWHEANEHALNTAKSFD